MFADGAVAGDVIRPLETRHHATYDTCPSFELVSPSPARVAAPCPFADTCGGCPWQMMNYPEQLHWKRRFVVDALNRIGKIPNSESLVAECVPSPRTWQYRNKVEFEVFLQGDKLCLGMHKKGSNELIALDECLLLPKALTKLPGKLAGALNFSVKENRDKLVRVALRHSNTTGSTELALYMLPSGVNRPLLAKTLGTNVELTSLVRVIIDGAMAERKVKKVEVLSGAGYWQERLKRATYKISAPSFFQANSAVAEAMIDKLNALIDEMDLEKSARIADLYSGAGTFTLPLAQRFDTVSAIESYGSSVRDLRRNLEENKLASRVQVIGGDVARELTALEPLALAVIDPPRSGLKQEAVRALLKAGAAYLVYVSCNPATMARDVGLLAQDYQLLSATPFDQFSQSYHVEVMALLKRR